MPSRSVRALLVCAAIAAVATARIHTVRAASTTIVISQLYGAGGNSGATYRNDFIELFNAGGTAIDVSAWSVQYASTQGSSWQRTNLTGTIQPGQYYLVAENSNAAVGTPLPTPDVTANIAMAAGAGKVALVNNQTTLTTGTVCPSGAALVDLVGYGTG